MKERTLLLGKERMETERKLNGLIALGDVDKKLNAFKRHRSDPCLERSELQALAA